MGVYKCGKYELQITEYLILSNDIRIYEKRDTYKHYVSSINAPLGCKVIDYSILEEFKNNDVISIHYKNNYNKPMVANIVIPKEHEIDTFVHILDNTVLKL